MAKKEVVSITLEELTQHIASAIKENLIVHKGVVLNEDAISKRNDYTE